MLKRLLVICGVLLLFLTACGSDKDSSAPADGSKSSSGLGDTLQPLNILSGGLLGGGGFDMEASGQEVSPDLRAALLTEEDLLPGYDSFDGWELAVSSDMDEGHVEMVWSTFFEGDVASGELGSVVKSGAVASPPAFLEEFGAGLDELIAMDLTAKDVQATGDSAVKGIEYKEFEFIDAPGLGEAGILLHMVMEMDARTVGAGGEPGWGSFEGGLTVNAYFFIRGDRMLMLLTMWPADELAPVDGLALAQIMDERAQQNP